MSSTFYTVIWEIQLDADSPVEAARLARAIQLDPNALVGTFDVYVDADPAPRNVVHVDLDEGRV